MRSITVLEPGWHSSLQDRGRPGFGHLGVPASGVIDRILSSLMNRMLGNRDDDAVIETAGGLVVQANSALLVASSDSGAVVSLRAGQRYQVQRTPERNFHYLAIRGGITAPTILGSVSQDRLSGLGPDPLMAGTTVSIGPEPDAPILVDQVAIAAPSRTVRIWPGPHLTMWRPDTWQEMLGGAWSTTALLDRIGVRVQGPALTRLVTTEISSEPLLDGAIQIPPDGQPIVMLRDHPTTGGYPVVALVDPQDLHLVAQAPAGKKLTLISGAQEQTRHRATGTVPGRVQ
jgi:biotin-dependent carboxylase-like uncharacterized protein